MGELQRRVKERSHRLKEAFDRHGLEQAIVPVRFQYDELSWHPSATINTRPGRMSCAGAGSEPLRRFFGTVFDAAAAAHHALAIIAGERFVRFNFVLPVTAAGRHGMNSIVGAAEWSSDGIMHRKQDYLSGSSFTRANTSLYWQGLPANSFALAFRWGFALGANPSL